MKWTQLFACRYLPWVINKVFPLLIKKRNINNISLREIKYLVLIIGNNRLSDQERRCIPLLRNRNVPSTRYVEIKAKPTTSQRA